MYTVAFKYTTRCGLWYTFPTTVNQSGYMVRATYQLLDTFSPPNWFYMPGGSNTEGSCEAKGTPSTDMQLWKALTFRTPLVYKSVG